MALFVRGMLVDVIRRLRRGVAPQSVYALAAFLATFIVSRLVVFAIMYNDAPDLYLRVNGTHIHHHVWGILLLAVSGLCLLVSERARRSPRLMAMVYGVGLGLTLDEFGMWLYLGGSYWQRASYDAAVAAAVILLIISVWPATRVVRRGMSTAGLAALAVSAAIALVIAVQSYRMGGRVLAHVREMVEPSIVTVDDVRSDNIR